MPDECGVPGEDGIILPRPMNLNSSRLERYGLYLIDDGQVQFLWVGKDAVPELLQDVFGQPTLDSVRVGKASLEVLDNPFSERVNAVIGKSRDKMGSTNFPHLYIIREDGDPSLRIWALTSLIEDRTDQNESYHQFLQVLRQRVNAG